MRSLLGSIPQSPDIEFGRCSSVAGVSATGGLLFNKLSSLIPRSFGGRCCVIVATWPNRSKHNTMHALPWGTRGVLSQLNGHAASIVL